MPPPRYTATSSSRSLSVLAPSSHCLYAAPCNKRTTTTNHKRRLHAENWSDFHSRHHSEAFHYSCQNERILTHCDSHGYLPCMLSHGNSSMSGSSSSTTSTSSSSHSGTRTTSPLSPRGSSSLSGSPLSNSQSSQASPNHKPQRPWGRRRRRLWQADRQRHESLRQSLSITA